MTKGELRKARKQARADGKPLDGELAINGRNESPAVMTKPKRTKSPSRYASRSEQHARYIDCGPSNWDDKDSPSGDY